MVWIIPWGILVVYDPHCLELPAVSVLHRIEFFRFLKEQRLCKMHIVWYDIHTFIFWFSVLNNKSCLQTRLLYSRETTLDEKWNALKNKFLGIVGRRHEKRILLWVYHKNFNMGYLWARKLKCLAKLFWIDDLTNSSPIRSHFSNFAADTL